MRTLSCERLARVKVQIVTPDILQVADPRWLKTKDRMCVPSRAPHSFVFLIFAGHVFFLLVLPANHWHATQAR